MFWKDLSWKVQAEAMGHSSQTASLSFRPPGVLEGLGSSPILGPAAAHSKGVTHALGEGVSPLVGVGVGRDLEDGAIASLPALPGDPHTPTHTQGRILGLHGRR